MSTIADEELRLLAANDRDVMHQLAALRFTTADGVPTVAGIVTVGREPPAFVPGAYVQFLRLAGPEITDDVIDEHRIARPLPDMLRELDELLRINVRTSVDLTSGAVEQRRPDYPLAALQQLTRNAVMHRTYEMSMAPVRVTWLSDRIEIQNPGGPYGQVTVENLGRPGIADYRNPTVAEAMRQLETLWGEDGQRQTLAGPLTPLLEGTGGLGEVHVERIGERLGLVAGDLTLSAFEDELSSQWSACLDGKSRAFRIVSAMWQLIIAAARRRGDDLVLVDVGEH